MADYFKGDADVASSIEAYVGVVKAETSRQLPPSRKFKNYQELYYDVSTTQELLYGVVADTKQLNIADYTITWMVTAATVNEKLNAFRDTFDEIDTETIDVKDLDTYLTIRGLLGQMSLEICEFTIHFLSSIGPQLHKLTSIYGSHHVFAACVNGFIQDALELSEHDIAIDAELLDNNEAKLRGLGVVILALHRDLVEGTASRKSVRVGEIFSLLANYFKTIYYSGKPNLFKELLDESSAASILSPLFPVQCFQNSSLAYNDLVNFFIYVGANYLTISLASDVVESKYNDEADIYFTCYLDLPTSDYKYMSNDNKSPDDDLQSFYKTAAPEPQVSSQKHLIKRHEVALLFIINYALKANDLKDLVSPSPKFTREVDQLSRSLTRLLSKYMNDEKSTSLKKYGSLSDMSQLDLQKVTQKARFRSLGCIAAWGSYKEKSISILKLLRILQNPDVQLMKSTFSFDNHSGFFQLVDNLEKDEFAGKWSYYKTVNKISQLMCLLRVKMMLTTLGITRLRERNLTKLLINSQDFEQEAKVKSLVNVQVEVQSDEKFYIFSLVQTPSDAGKSVTRLLKLQQAISEISLYINSQ